MPNDCWCEVRIGADSERINFFFETEFSFEKLRPFPIGSDEDWHEWNHTNWGSKWDRTRYLLIRRGEKGMEIKFTTAWSPPTELFKYLVETYHDVWIRCDWSEEGGLAGVFVVRWNEEKNEIEITDSSWLDWCMEEWNMRMRPMDNTG